MIVCTKIEYLLSLELSAEISIFFQLSTMKEMGQTYLLLI